MFELDPHPCANWWHQIHAHWRARWPSQRHTWLGPTRWNRSQYIWNIQHQPSALFRVHVSKHGATIFTVVTAVRAASVSIHGITTGICETTPSRESVKLCLYSPRLILWVTLST